MKELLFLLGSGVSIPAGMPRTDEITMGVLSGERVWRHTDGRYLAGDTTLAMPANKQVLQRVLQLVNTVHNQISQYYSDRPTHPANYENIGFVIGQLADTISREFDNPAVLPQVEKLLSPSSTYVNEEDLAKIASEARNYVHDVVCSMLQRPHNGAYLRFFQDAAVEGSSQLVVFTLNHDTVLQSALDDLGVEYEDGFSKSEDPDRPRYWSPEALETQTCRLSVVPLHGCIRWFRPRSEAGNAVVVLPEDDDLFEMVEPRPLILVGTFNKMLQYTSGIFADLHCLFHRHLRKADCLIACGYGFGDKGINTKLVQWLNTSRCRRLVVVHPNPEELRCCSRGAISKQWIEWKNAGQLVELPKRAEQVSWSDLRALVIPEG